MAYYADLQGILPGLTKSTDVPSRLGLGVFGAPGLPSRAGR